MGRTNHLVNWPWDHLLADSPSPVNTSVKITTSSWRQRRVQHGGGTIYWRLSCITRPSAESAAASAPRSSSSASLSRSSATCLRLSMSSLRCSISLSIFHPCPWFSTCALRIRLAIAAASPCTRWHARQSRFDLEISIRWGSQSHPS